MTMKGSDLLLISTYDSWTLLWNPDLIFLTSSDFEETNRAYCAFTMGNIGLTALITAQNTVLEVSGSAFSTTSPRVQESIV